MCWSWHNSRNQSDPVSVGGIGMICEHEMAVEPVPPRTRGCEECLKTGLRWVHLRWCLTCGHVGCCDSSPGRHATRHFHQTTHPVVASYEPGEPGPGATSMRRSWTCRKRRSRICGSGGDSDEKPKNNPRARPWRAQR